MLVRFAVQANIEFEFECFFTIQMSKSFRTFFYKDDTQMNGHLYMLARQKSCQSKPDQHVGLICWTTDRLTTDKI